MLIVMNPLKVVLLKWLHVASPRWSPPLLTFQLLMHTWMSSTVLPTFHSILNPTLVRYSCGSSTPHNSTQCTATGTFVTHFLYHPSFLCSSHITTDHWEDQEGVPHAEGAEGVW